MINTNYLIKTGNYYNTSLQRVSFGGHGYKIKQDYGRDEFVSLTPKISKKDVSALNKHVALFPLDISYKKSMLVNMGENPKNTYRLNSIAGPQEFNSFLSEHNNHEYIYKPGDRPFLRQHEVDSHTMENVETGRYGANLHIHSLHSDGQLTIQEILDQAVAYADKRVEKNGAHEPFYIAITDHNTAEGSKEALKLIYENPKKYQNLRVILGAEISAKMPEVRGFQFKKPRPVHILMMCMDPNSEAVQNYIKSLSEESHNVMFARYTTLEEMTEALKDEKSIRYGFAHPAYPDMKNFLKSSNRYKAAVLESIQHFQNVTKDKGLFVEGYYQGYMNELATDKKLLKLIRRFCDYLDLLKDGGMDTHMRNIFQSGAKLVKKK